MLICGWRPDLNRVVWLMVFELDGVNQLLARGFHSRQRLAFFSFGFGK